MKKTPDIELRLVKLGWVKGFLTSSKTAYFKRKRMCTIYSNKVCFKRVMELETVELMRGPVEEGIE